MRVSLIASPYDLGRDGEGMALGPARYLEAGADRALTAEGFEVNVETVERGGDFEDEISAVAGVNARLAERVRAAHADGTFPLVLGGNCDTALGALAGTGGVGIVWFDAHGDFNTPETSRSGYLAGMPVAIATGRCHEALWRSVGGGEPVPDARVLMIGVRDLDAEEEMRLRESGISPVLASAVNEAGVKESLSDALAGLRSRVEEVYLHLDVDVLDPGECPGVSFPVPGGLPVDSVEEAVRAIAGSVRVWATSLTAYNPEEDVEDKTLRAGLRLMGALAKAGKGA